MAYRAFRYLILLFVLAFITDAKTASRADEPGESTPTLGDIVDAWRERQKVIRSGRFSWTAKITHAAGYWGRNKEELMPAEDVTFNVEFELAFDGRKYHHVRRGLFLDSDMHELAERVVEASYDLENSKYLFGKFPRSSVAIGRIGVHSEYQVRPVAFVHPLMLAIRPNVVENSGINLDEWTVSPKRELVGNRQCVIIVRNDGDAPRINESYALDYERKYLILRYVKEVDGSPFLDFVIDYSDDPVCGPVPVGWEHSLRSNGKLWLSHDATVTSREFNLPIADSEFDILFPEDTIVYDRRKTNSSVLLVADEAGELQLRLSAPVDTGVAANVPEPRGPSRVTSTLISVIMLISVVIVLVVIQNRNKSDTES